LYLFTPLEAEQKQHQYEASCQIEQMQRGSGVACERSDGNYRHPDD